MLKVGWLVSLPHRVKRFWLHVIWRNEAWPAGARPWFGRAVIVLARTLYLVGTAFSRERLRLRAAALTHITLLSLVPALAVAFSVFTAFGGLQSVGERLKNLVLHSLAGNQQEQVIDYLDGFIESAHAGQLGAIGTAFLVMTAVALLSDVEKAFNDIWGINRGRSLLQRFQVFWPLVTLGPILMGLSLSFTATVATSDVVRWAENALLGFELVGQLATGFLVCVFFALVYHIVPNTSVRPLSAAIGGLVAGLLWFTAQQLYAYYAAYAISFSALYGSLSAIPFFIIWVYVSWNVILLGASLTFAVQSSRSYEPDRRVSQTERELVAAHLALVVATRFAQGRGPEDAQALIDEAQVPPRVANRVLESLVDAQVLTEAHVSEGIGYAPGKPLNQITLYEVVQAVRVRGARAFEALDPIGSHGHESVREALRSAEVALQRALSTPLSELVERVESEEREGPSGPEPVALSR
jgi:membrane protein